MENFSNQFLESNKHILAEYGRKWVYDPLHNWSRQWEYPFVYANIGGFIVNKKNSRIKILDAGSGVTFFPFYITSTFNHVKVDCCDNDKSFKSAFSKIDANSKHLINFYSADIRHLPFENNSYDIVYCISVLEHTECFETVIQEFKRVLKHNGLLILTFDISIDGLANIPIVKAVKLIKTLQKYFLFVNDFDLNQFLEILEDKRNILSIESMRNSNKEILLKRSPFSTLITILKFSKDHFPKTFNNLKVCYIALKNILKSILKGHIPKTLNNLTVCCIALKNK